MVILKYNTVRLPVRYARTLLIVHNAIQAICCLTIVIVSTITHAHRASGSTNYGKVFSLLSVSTCPENTVQS
jgi:hypothetical protein